MGRDIYDRFEVARTVFEAADAVLGTPLTRLMFEGPEAELTDTINAQPAILTHSIAVLASLQSVAADWELPPIYSAGHSLGEYSALVAVKALDFVDAVRLVRSRGKAMKQAGQLVPGAMAAILGLDDGRVSDICQSIEMVQIANFNAPGQIVISGEKEAVARVADLAKQSGAKRVIELAVSIAAHSELMRPAAAQFSPAVDKVELREPLVPIVSNISAEPIRDVRAIRSEMLAQLTSSVQWVKSVEWMCANGVEQFVEIGPKDVLTGLVKRIAPNVQAFSIRDVSSIDKIVQGAPA